MDEVPGSPCQFSEAPRHREGSLGLRGRFRGMNVIVGRADVVRCFPQGGLEYGDGLVMISQEGPSPERPWKASYRSPASLGGAFTQSIMFFVDDVDAHCAHARSRGARVVEEPATHDYGDDYWTDRSYGALDPEGHLWWVVQRLRNPRGK